MLTRFDVPRWRQRFCLRNVRPESQFDFISFDACCRYNGIEGVRFTAYEQELSEHMVDTFVSLASGFSPSFWPMYRSGLLPNKPFVFFNEALQRYLRSADSDESLQWGVAGQLFGNTTRYHRQTCDFWDGFGYQQ